MKALLTLIIVSLFASCSSNTTPAVVKSERVKARLHEVNSSQGITIRYIDTTFHVGDTTNLLCADGSYHYFAILPK